MNIKFITKILVLVVMLSSQSYGFMGSGSNNIDTVKEARYNYDESITFEEALSKNSGFSSVEWIEKKDKYGRTLVAAKAQLTDKEKNSLKVEGDVALMYAFYVDGDDFELDSVLIFENGRMSSIASPHVYGSRESALKTLYANRYVK